MENNDETDVFGFRKSNYDDKKIAKMPVFRDEMFYNMNHKRRGLALIFNHENFQIDKLRSRTGTEVDAKNLKTTLQNLGFEVIIHQDLTVRKVLDEVEKGGCSTNRIFKYFLEANYFVCFSC